MGRIPLLVIIPKEVYKKSSNSVIYYVQDKLSCKKYKFYEIGGRWDHYLKKPETLQDFLDIDLGFVSPVKYNSIRVEDFIYQYDKFAELNASILDNNLELKQCHPSLLKDHWDDYLVIVDTT